MIYRLIKNFLKYVFTPLLVIAFIWVGYFIIFANFHKVDDDIFRSAQLRSVNMPYYIKKYDIKSILNLRGDTDKPWHKKELEIVDEYGISHYDYGIGDREVRTLKEMKDIVKLIKEAPKPLLIHCKAGADRTGLAVALYLYEVKKDENAEDKAFSLLYGHFPWLGSKTVAMDRSFEIYKKDTQ